MKKLLLFLLGIILVSCNKLNLNDVEIVKANTEQVFGISFPYEQDWVSTSKGSIDVNLNGYSKVLVLCSSDSVMTILNSSEQSGTIYFDVPNTYDNLYLAFVKENGEYYYEKLGDIKLRRAQSVNYNLSENDLIVTGTVESFASQRNWLPGEVLYTTNILSMNVDDYSSSFKDIFRDVIFNYFPNGKNYNNMSKIIRSGYYNENGYIITTGQGPIILSPVYKNDGGYQEIVNSDIYYYYFKGDLSVEEIEALPKYKAIQVDEIYTNNNNGNIAKTKSYALVYWGDDIPEIGVTSGTYSFPENYKIGFMYRSKTTSDNKKKQGELYSDGRLNYNINNWGNFKTSKLSSTDPRMGWITVNNKSFLCIESGTDADINDLIIEVEGSFYPIIVIPGEYEQQFYTFCYEDTKFGDYDLNDVVLKGARLDDTHVEWTLMACGANDELFIYNIDSKHINNSIEVHKLFNKLPSNFINTQKGDNTPYIKDTVVVNKNYSFLNEDTQPFIINKSKNLAVKVSRKGEDPHAIMIPYDFKWPLERVCIKDAYLDFNNWGAKLIEETDWYKYPVEIKIY